jgi:cytochrome c peroxidase
MDVLPDTWEDIGMTGSEATRLGRAAGSQALNEKTIELRGAPARYAHADSLCPIIPGYQILHELGRGAVGVVYKARDVRLQRLVAVKTILSGSFTAPDQVARFRTETQAVARMQHANIVQIYDVGEVRGLPYCALEFVDGGTLTNAVREQPMPPREAAGLLETLARAMHSAHQRGIVHRDLKPDNILLTSERVPKISDFGLAKCLEADKGHTETGSILGTPSFMAPEQATGDTKQVGPAADIWALGGILYYLLTAKLPFHGLTVLDTLEQVRHREPVPPSGVRANVPRDLETICLKCLQKDPPRRYPSAAALADDLRRFLDQVPIEARRVRRWERVFRQIKSRPTTSALAGLLVLVLGLLGCSLVWLWRTQATRYQAVDDRPYDLKTPLGLPGVSTPPDNPLTEARVELGKQLFFDRRLSGDNTLACASCHDPTKGWSNGKPVTAGAGGHLGVRNVPSILNVSYQTFLFWDGRASSLEEQALGPILNPDEMAMPSLQELELRLNRIPAYREAFQRVFGSEASAENIGKALAAFERTILAGDTPYDRYKAGDKEALSEQALRGMKLFFHKAHCSACHSGPTFSDGGFHNIGVGLDKPNPDVGREKVSAMHCDHGSFKTPSLRDVERTAPYMHDGSMKTLEEVIEHYDRGGIKNPQLDEEIFPLKLSKQEKRDLAAFLRYGLTSSAYPFATPPKLPE